MVAAQEGSDVLPYERPRPVREPWYKPKYKGQFAFQLKNGGGMKLVREPRARGTTSRSVPSGVATGTPTSSNATSQPTLAKRPAPNSVECSHGKTAHTAFAFPLGPHLSCIRDPRSEKSAARTSPSFPGRIGASSPSAISQSIETNHMSFQPKTRPISQEQLVNEVKGIYAGLVMVEKKCVAICLEQSESTDKVSDEQWQALIALHRTLLHEHHDFFLVGQRPTISPALRRLPTEYAMPARMWRHGIHSFLELLRHRLPDSLEHMLTFVYLAYQMMGLLQETVPEDSEIWIECLRDLAHYHRAIAEADWRDREIWSSATRMRHDRRIPLDWQACESLQDRRCRVLADPDAVNKLRAFADAGASSSRYALDSTSAMLRKLDCSDYMNARSHFELQAALVSRECLSVVLDQVMDPENPASRLEDQKNLVLEAQGWYTLLRESEH